MSLWCSVYVEVLFWSSIDEADITHRWSVAAGGRDAAVVETFALQMKKKKKYFCFYSFLQIFLVFF